MWRLRLTACFCLRLRGDALGHQNCALARLNHLGPLIKRGKFVVDRIRAPFSYNPGIAISDVKIDARKRQGLIPNWHLGGMILNIRCTSSLYEHKIAVTVKEEDMTSANVRETALRPHSDKKTTALLLAELRKVQDRVKALEAAQIEFQKRMRSLENDLAEMAGSLDPDL